MILVICFLESMGMYANGVRVFIIDNCNVTVLAFGIRPQSPSTNKKAPAVCYEY